ncbi:MAG: hypothetical protein R3B48_02185 [Kofleriaceae bacterium]
MLTLPALDLVDLAAVSGGQGANTDTRESRLGVTTIRGVPIPYRKETVSKTRTEFGACVDGSNASCERQGGSNETVGTCMLNGINTCTQATK